MGTAFVYMAYAADDRAEVGALADFIREKGWSVCFGRLVEPGVDDGDFNAERISAAARVVVVWSSNAANSAMVRADALEAARQSKLVIVALDDAASPVRGASVVKLQNWAGATDTTAFEGVLDGLGPADRPRWRSRGVIIPYAGRRNARTMWWSSGAALTSGLLVAFLALGIATVAPHPSPTNPGAGETAGAQEVYAAPSETSGAVGEEWGGLPEQDINTIRGFMRERGETRAGESARNIATRLEEFAWQDIFKAGDLLARIGRLAEFRIDFPEGPHAGEAAKLDGQYRDLMVRIRSDLVSLGFIPAAGKADLETLRTGVRAYERSVGLGTSGMVTEKLAGLLSIAVENRAPVR